MPVQCSRLRADVQSLGFVSGVSPGGMVRLVHAVVRSFLMAFKAGRAAPISGQRTQTLFHLVLQKQDAARLQLLQERFEMLYRSMTRDGLEVRNSD